MAQSYALRLCGAASVFLAGCDVTPAVLELQNKLDATVKQTSALESQVSLLQSEVKSLRDELSAITWRMSQDETSRGWERIAFLTPDDQGYSTIKSRFGLLTVQIVDVKPYAKGSKIQLRFGNPLAATLRGVKTTIDWGKTDKLGMPMNDSAKSKEVSLIEPLPAGSWTNVSVVLDGVSSNELGFVRLKDVTHDGISLMGK